MISDNTVAANSTLPRLDGVRVLASFAGGMLFGSERANIEVFRCLKELGAEVRVVTSGTHGLTQVQSELTRAGLEWTTAPFGTQWARWLLGWHGLYLWPRNIYGLLVTNWRVWHEARRWRATHLYVANVTHYSYASLALKFLPSLLVYRVGDEFPRHNFIYRWFTRGLLRRTDLFVAISDFIRRHCLAVGTGGGCIRTIYNFPPRRIEVGERPVLPSVPDGAVVLTYVGQISERKGVLVLLEAVSELLRRKVNIALWLVGEPGWNAAWFAELKSRFTGEALCDRVMFLGYQKDVAAFLENSDLHVCPSLETEALSNVVLEAKQAGVPSVVFPTGGLPELIEQGVDGWVCADCSVAALRDGLMKFVTDASLRKRTGAAARRSLEEKFGRERFVRQWAEVFLEAPRFRGQSHPDRNQ